jgi:hypothetical protein
MGVQPDHPHGGELMPRPPRTPDALRMAIARLAPYRLAEMERQKEEAFTLAAQHDTMGPIRGWLTIWAGEVEIERRPELASRRQAAERSVQTLDRHDPAWRNAMDELRKVIEEARKDTT